MNREILREFNKCVNDPIYAITEHLKIWDRSLGQRVPFSLDRKQIQVFSDIHNNRFNLIKKSRQVSTTTLMAAIAAIKSATANPQKKETIISVHSNHNMCVEFIEKVRDFLYDLPKEFFQDNPNNKEIFQVNRKNEITLFNGSKIKAVVPTVDAFRSWDISWLIVDEAAFVKVDPSMIYSTFPSLGINGKITILSTPNGMDSLFFPIYCETMLGNTDFNIIEWMWYHNSRHNEGLTWIKFGHPFIPEEEFTEESYRLKELQGYRPTSKWYRNMYKLIGPTNAKAELDTHFFK